VPRATTLALSGQQRSSCPEVRLNAQVHPAVPMPRPGRPTPKCIQAGGVIGVAAGPNASAKPAALYNMRTPSP
jgi:hypothetical protein